jgi:peptidoglycan/LPS O-acetylase OafA/YrhL
MAHRARSISSVWLDFIRGIAAIVVFAGHARVLFVGSILSHVGMGAVPKHTAAGAAPLEVTAIGHEAVIVFFVLSGYLVGGSVIRALRDGAWSPGRYVAQRLSRLWTVLVPALIVGFILDHLGVKLFGTEGIYGAPAGQGIVFPDFANRLSLDVFLGNLLFVQGIWVHTFGTNSPLWTLSYEFWFYMAFPLLALILWRGTTVPTKMACGAFLVLIGLFVGWRICFYFLIWLLGAALELLPRRLSATTARWCFRVYGPIFVVICLLLLKNKVEILLADSIQAIAFAVLCYFLLHATETANETIFSKASVAISEMSYTLYLAHAPVLVFICAVLMDQWAPWSLDVPGVLKFGGVLVASFAYAWVMYWLFERNTSVVRAAMQKLVPSRALDFAFRTSNSPRHT